MDPISKENFKFQRKIKKNFQGFSKINSSNFKRIFQISKSKKKKKKEENSKFQIPKN